MDSWFCGLLGAPFEAEPTRTRRSRPAFYDSMELSCDVARDVGAPLIFVSEDGFFLLASCIHTFICVYIYIYIFVCRYIIYTYVYTTYISMYMKPISIAEARAAQNSSWLANAPPVRLVESLARP